MSAAAEPILRARDVSKTFRYRPYERGTLTLKSAIVDALLLRPRPAVVEVHALDSVSLELAPGEALGVIGPNGAGKTTLLRILSGVYKPDSGEVAVRGRVGSLIELGAGFHPELTGRENIEVSGLIYGLTREQIRERQDAIAKFAGIEAFLDAPTRTYSAGMWLRLGFAVAVEVEPSVLLVDEALAVGDPAFQEQCLARVTEMRKRGTALVLVTHELAAVETLCDRAVLLERGRVTASGASREVVARFRESIRAPASAGA